MKHILITISLTIYYMTLGIASAAILIALAELLQALLH